MGPTWKWGLAAALLGAAGGPAPAQTAVPLARPAPKAVVVVNGEEITAAQLEAQLQGEGPVPIHLPEAQRRQQQLGALRLLIDELLMRQFLRKNTPEVAPGVLDKRLAEVAAALKGQDKTPAEYCQELGQTPEQFKADLADRLRWAEYARARLDDAALEKFYKDNKDWFDETQVRARHIVLRLPEAAGQSERAKARAKLQGLRAQIAAGKLDFAAAAKAHSEDPRASGGGDLGFFPRKWIYDEAFSRAAFALPVGQVSDVVQTDYGLHLIQVTERKPGKESKFAEVKEAVREFCAEELRQEILARERRAAKVSEVHLP